VFVSAAKPVHRDLARLMREDGASIPRIAESLRVSQSSVSGWVRDVVLTDEQRARLTAASAEPSGRLAGNVARSHNSRERRRAAQEHGRALAREAPPLHQAGCMLFWAEGSRKRNGVYFTNADVAMHRYFLRFLRECYAVRDEDLALTISCYLGNGLSVEEVEAWWSEQLELPRSRLRRTIVDRRPTSSKGVHRPLLHGTARLSLHPTFVVQSIYGAIQEYTGIDRPEWLDLDTPGRPIFRRDDVDAGR
jgi:hypothetical protein